MRFELLDPADPVWLETLAVSEHDVYHRPEWALGHAKHDDGRARSIHVTDGTSHLLMPIIQRSMGDGYWDAISPYGYASPVVSEGAPASFVSASLDHAIEQLQKAGCVSLFSRQHPLLELPVRVPVGRVVDHGTTVSVDLSLPPEVLWQRTRKGHRSDISRAHRAGIVVQRDLLKEHLRVFVDLYHATMRRVGATDYYFFSREDIVTLSELLGPMLELWIAIESGAVIGGALFLFARQSGIVQYHLSASSEAGADRQPAKVLLDAVRQNAKDRGYQRLHLGGGLGAQADSLLQFKSGFATDSHPYRSWQVVVDSAQYSSLCNKVSQQTRASSGYFPAYRSPSTGVSHDPGSAHRTPPNRDL